MSFPPAPPQPKTALGHYRLLAPSASVRVSPLCLGAMNFGNAWKEFMGECDQGTVEEILDFYYASGGNFIDTANNYQSEESEKWIGEWMKKRGNRDQMVIATKFTTCYRAGLGDKEIIINTAVLYVHWWDFTCSIPELMQSLNTMVAKGKVLYLGISDTPAWVVSKCNEYARQNAMRQFSVYQGRWSAEHRDFERDIIPMCAAEGMGLAPWGALGGGHFKSDEQRKSSEGRKMGDASEAAIKISKVLERIAKAKKAQITSVALAYVMHKTPYVFPIVGGRKLEHLKGNIEGLTIELSEQEVKDIEDSSPFDIGFPQNFLGGSSGVKSPNDIWLMGMAGVQQHVQWPKAIGPVRP